ncbi:hypothetical protein V2J09_019477 [Rumex salicifolius]
MIFDHSPPAAALGGDEPNNKQTQIPVVDLSSPNCKKRLVKACQELGFCKVINHDVPSEFISDLEDQAINFFNLPLHQKQRASASPNNPFGYGNKLIGRKGDVGWLDCAVSNYLMATKKVACRVLEALAEGLHLDQNDAFSRMLKDDKSDSCFRMNHYPPCPSELEALAGGKLVGFGEHSDPQIISVLRSNDACGLEILTGDGNWLPVPSDPHSFFLIVMSNGRFKSVRHRVVAQGKRSRLSMIYFGGPPLSEKIAPLTSLIGEGEDRLYKEFTWKEYKMAAYNTRLADYRLRLFQNTNSP